MRGRHASTTCWAWKKTYAQTKKGFFALSPQPAPLPAPLPLSLPHSLPSSHTHTHPPVQIKQGYPNPVTHSIPS